MNKVILLGNLTKDITIRYSQGGLAIGNTSIATNRRYKSQDGQQKEEVCFVGLTMFGKTAEIANQYLAKGKKVMIEGRLQLDQWTDQNGQKQSKHSVVVENLQMLGSKNDTEPKTKTPESKPVAKNDEPISDYTVDDDKIPF